MKRDLSQYTTHTVFKKSFKKECCICHKSFTTVYQGKGVCSFDCRAEKKRECARAFQRRKRKKKKCKPCEVCGFKETSDLHHESRKTYILCPNHHALITRGIKTIEQLFENK